MGVHAVGETASGGVPSRVGFHVLMTKQSKKERKKNKPLSRLNDDMRFVQDVASAVWCDCNRGRTPAVKHREQLTTGREGLGSVLMGMVS